MSLDPDRDVHPCRFLFPRSCRNNDTLDQLEPAWLASRIFHLCGPPWHPSVSAGVQACLLPCSQFSCATGYVGKSVCGTGLRVVVVLQKHTLSSSTCKLKFLRVATLHLSCSIPSSGDVSVRVRPSPSPPFESIAAFLFSFSASHLLKSVQSFSPHSLSQKVVSSVLTFQDFDFQRNFKTKNDLKGVEKFQNLKKKEQAKWKRATVFSIHLSGKLKTENQKLKCQTQHKHE